MVRSMAIAAALAGVFVVGAVPLFAQGKGNGLSRGLGAAAKGASNSGQARSGGPLSRVGNSAGRGNSSFGRAGGTMQRADAALTRGMASSSEAVGEDQALARQQQILDHRLGQADKLRALSEQNGNERLLGTADRMEANATTNFQRQQERLTNPTTDSTSGSGTDPTVSPSQEDGAPAAVTRQPRRGFWFRSR
jgi:hypothetical protein